MASFHNVSCSKFQVHCADRRVFPHNPDVSEAFLRFLNFLLFQDRVVSRMLNPQSESTQSAQGYV